MKRFFILIAALILSASAMFAQGLTQLPNDTSVRKGVLENGLTYYIRHNALPEDRAEFYLATNVGAVQEAEDQDGLAHFLEHMCFNGTKHFPDKGILDYLQSIGASFGGNVNAMTSVEQTVYMLTNIPLVRESVIDTCIMIMRDYAHFVTNDPVEIDKERSVIIEEKRQGNNAGRRVWEKSQPYYYGDSKYNGVTVIGSYESLENFKHESLVAFYETWYHPKNQAFIVVGDIDVDAVEQKIKDIFGVIPAPVDPKPIELIPIPGNEEPIVGIVTDPELTSTDIEILWKREARPEMFNSTVEGLSIDLVESIIGQVMRERFNDITSDPNAPYLSAGFGIYGLCESTEIVDGTITAKEGDAIPAFRAFMTEVEKMRRYGLSAAEVERAKENILAGYESSAQKADTRKNGQLIWELINNFFDNNSYAHPKDKLEIVKAILSQISSDLINAYISQLIPENNMVIVYTAPEKEGLATPTEAELLAVVEEVKNADIQPNEEEVMAAELMDSSKLKGSKVKKSEDYVYGSTKWTLKNGMTVILRPSDLEKDRIQIQLVKKGGMTLIPQEDLYCFEDNIWSAYSSTTGLSEFPQTELMKMLSGKNVHASSYISGLTHGVSASSNVKDIETAFQLLYLNFMEPRFDQKEFEQGLNQIKAVLPNLLNQPNFKLQEQMSKTLFGHNPREMFITMEMVEKADLNIIERNFRELFKDAAGATVVIAGDFTLENIKPLVEKYLGSIPKGKTATDWIDFGIPYFVRGDVLNDFKVHMESPVTTVLDVYTAQLPYTQENVVAMEAVAYILNMRYTTSLREEAGGTYGAGVSEMSLNAPEELGGLQVYFQCQPAMADQLRGLVTKGIEDLIAEGPTASEFEMTINNLKKNIPERKLNNYYWVSAINNYTLFGTETVDAYEAAVNALTPEQIQQVTKALIDAGNNAELVMRPEE